MRINEFDQHIGETVEPVDFHYPDFKALSGSFCNYRAHLRGAASRRYLAVLPCRPCSS